MITITELKINNHTKPDLQLSISTNKPEHMAELLEATRKMTKYFKRSYKHNKPHSNDNRNGHTNTNHYNNSHSDRHKHKPCNNSNNNNSTQTSKNAFTEPENSNEHCDSDSSGSLLYSSPDLRMTFKGK